MSEVIWAMDRIKIPTKRKLKANRSFYYNWKVLSACALTSVCSVCCVVFVWISLGKMEQIKKEIITLSQRGHEKNSTTPADHFQEVNSETDKSNVTRKDVPSPDHLRAFRNGYRTKLQRTNRKMSNFQAADVPLDLPIQQFMISAVHYVPIGVTAASIRNDFVNNAMCVHKWNGVVCRNNTYSNHEPNHITEFWQRAPWTKTHSGDVLSLGVNRSAPGVFRVEKGGLYLLYLNVLISATYSKHDVGIFISDNKKLVCRENLDVVRHAGSRSSNPKAKTCSISGVFYIEQNNTISVKIITMNTSIYLDSYNTNFGAVLLASMT